MATITSKRIQEIFKQVKKVVTFKKDQHFLHFLRVQDGFVSATDFERGIYIPVTELAGLDTFLPLSLAEIAKQTTPPITITVSADDRTLQVNTYTLQLPDKATYPHHPAFPPDDAYATITVADALWATFTQFEITSPLYVQVADGVLTICKTDRKQAVGFTQPTTASNMQVAIPGKFAPSFPLTLAVTETERGQQLFIKQGEHTLWGYPEFIAPFPQHDLSEAALLATINSHPTAFDQFVRLVGAGRRPRDRVTLIINPQGMIGHIVAAEFITCVACAAATTGAGVFSLPLVALRQLPSATFAFTHRALRLVAHGVVYLHALTHEPTMLMRRTERKFFPATHLLRAAFRCNCADTGHTTYQGGMDQPTFRWEMFRAPLYVAYTLVMQSLVYGDEKKHDRFLSIRIRKLPNDRYFYLNDGESTIDRTTTLKLAKELGVAAALEKFPSQPFLRIVAWDPPDTRHRYQSKANPEEQL